MSKMNEQNLREAIAKSNSIAQAIKSLDMSVTTSNYKTFHRNVKKYAIDTSHFLGQAHLKGKDRKTIHTHSLEEVLVENSSYTYIAHLKKRIVRAGLLDYKCNNKNCAIVDWQGKPLALQLDHINGIPNDHRIENLRFLCPNCHSQTDTFAGRNKK